MKTVLQRVSSGSVLIDGKIVGKIGLGYVILLGVKEGDNEENAKKMVEKIVNLRVFADDKDKMNRSLLDVSGEILVISQFTLYADCKKGRRPSFIKAAPPEYAKQLYKFFIKELERIGVKHVAEGEFGAYMSVEIVNDGPVTIILDSEEL